jgi:hypothetical protein
MQRKFETKYDQLKDRQQEKLLNNTHAPYIQTWQFNVSLALSFLEYVGCY